MMCFPSKNPAFMRSNVTDTPALFCLPLAEFNFFFNFLLMFGLLGHNNLSAGCAVRYHITVMFIQIQSSPIVKCTKLYAPCHSQHRAFLHCNPNKCMRRHICKHTITPQIRGLIWSYSRPALLGFLNCVHCILCCNDYCSIWRRWL